MAWLFQGGGYALYKRFYAEATKLNIEPFMVQPMGPDPLGWFKAPINSLDDMRKLKYRAPPGLDLTQSPVPATPPELLGAAEELLLQDLTTRYSAGVAASGLAQGVKGLWPRITRRITTKDGPVHHRESQGTGGYLAWAGSRLSRTLGDLTRPEVRRQSRQLAQLSQWLDR